MNSTAYSSKLATRVILSLGIALLAYSAVRSALLCFTVDEAFTFQAYVKHTLFFPEEYSMHTANFHMLNTWLMIVSAKLFGIAEWALRLPNVLAHALYLFFTAKFALKNKSVWTAAGVFILLNVHPYLLDFFSVARGYGLSFGLLAGALWYLTEYAGEQKQQKHLVFSVLFAGLAMWASFVTLPALLGIAFLLFCLTMLAPELNTKQKWQRVAIISGVCIAFVAIAFPVIRKMQTAGAFYWGQNELWNGTLRGLGGLLSYSVNGDIHLHQQAEGWIVATVLLLSVSLLIYAVLKNRALSFVRNEITVLCALLLCGVAAIVAQHVLLGSPYPGGRTCLWMFVIFLWAICSALRTITFPKLLPPVVLTAAVCFQLAFAVPDFNLRYTQEWQYCTNVQDAVELLSERIRSGAERNPAVTVATDPQFGNIAEYYLQRMNIRNMAFVNTSPAEDPMAEYYLISKHEQHIVPVTDTVMVYRNSALILLRNRSLARYKGTWSSADAMTSSSFTLDAAESRAVLFTDTFTGPDTAHVQVNIAAFISFPTKSTAGVFQFWLDRNDTNIWNSYAVCEPRMDSLAAVYRIGRTFPVEFAPGDVFKIHFVPYKDPGGTIEISRFHAQLRVEE